MDFYNDIEHFLRELEAKMREENARALHQLYMQPVFSIFQKARAHDALYRLDLIETTPQLRIVLPTDEGAVKFSVYLVQLSSVHPLFMTFAHVTQYQGSKDFEKERSTTEWHLLSSLGEMMKRSFWIGRETACFPPEIVVQKLL